jgi:hypothetical protein
MVTMMMMEKRTLVGLQAMRMTQAQIGTHRTSPMIQVRVTRMIQVTLPMMALVRADPEAINDRALQMVNDRGTICTLSSRLLTRPTI